VGLPCQIHGVRKAEAYIKDLDKKLVVHMGLFCSHTVNYNGTIFLLRKLGLSPRLVREIAYRGRGWPGHLVCKLANGMELTFPYAESWNAYWTIFSSFFYTPLRCLMCFDETNELADISLGDAWLRKFKYDKVGRSLVVVRTDRGREIIESALSEGVLLLEDISPSEVELSQSEALKFKKKDINSRLALLKKLGKEVPNFKVNSYLGTYNFFSILRNSFVLFNGRISNDESFDKFLVSVPFPIFRLYHGVYKILCAI
jgi:coenzyme F420 hydrogenase subunit beta